MQGPPKPFWSNSRNARRHIRVIVARKPIEAAPQLREAQAHGVAPGTLVLEAANDS